MGISLLTALLIGGGETEQVLYQEKAGSGKWGWQAQHSREHQHHPYLPIFTVKAVFDTEEEAKADLEAAVRMCKQVTDNILDGKGEKEENG